MLNYLVWDYIKDLVEHRRNGTKAEIREVILAESFSIIIPEMAYQYYVQYYSKVELYLRERAFRIIFALKYVERMD